MVDFAGLGTGRFCPIGRTHNGEISQFASSYQTNDAFTFVMSSGTQEKNSRVAKCDIVTQLATFWQYGTAGGISATNASPTSLIGSLTDGQTCNGENRMTAVTNRLNKPQRFAGSQ